MKDFLAIELVRDVTGQAMGFAQPAVLVVLRFHRPLPKEWPNRLAQAFRGPCLPTLAHAQPERALLEQAGHTVVELLKAQGLPIFSTPVVVQHDGTAWRLFVPTLTGCHAQTRVLLEEVFATTNLALSSDVPVQPSGRLLMALKALQREAPRGKNTLPMLIAANRMGIPWSRIHDNVFRLGQGSRARWIDSSITDRTPSVSVALAKQKVATAAILRSRQIPVPRHHLVGSEDQALAAAQAIGYPIVVKPANLDRGMGVTAGLRTPDSVRRAYQAARKLSNQVLVESHFEGKDYRVHVFNGEVFRVRHRIPGGVTGDGASTVESLLKTLNADPRRGKPGSNDDLIRIHLDDEALELLQERGMGPLDIPVAGEFIQLRRIANVSVGGISVPVGIEEVHPDNLALARRAVAALKLDLAAVDLLIPDIRKSWVEVGAAICEINAQPQFGADAPLWLFERMLPGQGRIPIVFVVDGGGGAGCWIESLRQRVHSIGTRLGFFDASGAWVGDERVATAHPMHALQAGTLLLEDDQIDAMLVFADASILRHGLPTDRFDALVLTGRASLPEHASLARVLARYGGQILIATGGDNWRPILSGSQVPAPTEADEADLEESLFSILSREHVGA